jgi:short-subunit dehydrogenase
MSANGFALVTGASSGLGADFARQLAARGYDLVITARREDRLRALAGEIEAAHGRTVVTIPLDLAEPGAPESLHMHAVEDGREISVLINNAGFGQFGQFLPRDPQEEERLIRLNIVAVLQLSRLFGADMARRRRGHILQVGSFAGFQPTPGYAVYGASKAFIRSFGEAIRYELARKNLVVTVLAPGMTETEFFETSGQRLTWWQRRASLSSETVVRIGLTALFKGKRTVITGWPNKLLAIAARFLPGTWVLYAAGRLNRGRLG